MRLLRKLTICRHLALLDSLAISSQAKPNVFDPKLHFSSETVPFIGTTVFKFLGLPFDISLSSEAVKNTLLIRLHSLCQTVDATTEIEALQAIYLSWDVMDAWTNIPPPFMGQTTS